MVEALAVIGAIGGGLVALLFTGYLFADLRHVMAGWTKAVGTVVEVREDVSSDSVVDREDWRVVLELPDGSVREHVFRGQSPVGHEPPFRMELLVDPRDPGHFTMAPAWGRTVVWVVVGAVACVAGVLTLNGL